MLAATGVQRFEVESSPQRRLLSFRFLSYEEPLRFALRYVTGVFEGGAVRRIFNPGVSAALSCSEGVKGGRHFGKGLS